MHRTLRTMAARCRWLVLPAAVLLLTDLGLRPRPGAFARGLWPSHDYMHAVDVPLDPAQAPTLGSHTLLGQEDGYGTSPAVTAPINTQASRSSYLVFHSGYASNTAPPTDNKGNAWQPLGTPVVYNGYNGAYDIKAYTVMSGHGGPAHTVSIVKNGNSTGELTLPFIEIRGATVIRDMAQTYPAQGAQVTSGSVTTTGPATLIALWWGDGFFLDNTAVPGDGFSVIESFLQLPPGSAVQCAVAYRQVAAAGTYHVTWTQAPDQGAVLYLLAFEAQDRIFADGFE